MPTATKWLTMADVARLVGPRRQGRPTHEQTVRTWCRVGLRGVVLRSVLRGGIRLTRARWVREFFDSVTELREARGQEPQPTPAVRRREHERAKAELRRQGIMPA